MLPSQRERFLMDKFIPGQYPDVEGFFCVEVKVPASIEYVHLLQGLVAQMCHYWNYSGSEDDRKLPAQLCENAYRETDWTACMNCEELTECITPLLADLRDQIIQDFTFKQYGTDDPTGVPLPEESRSANQAGTSNPTCDYDILWSQCLQVMEYTVDVVLAVLAQAEAATNPTELAQVLTDLPVIDELGGDAIAGYIGFVQDCLAENYEADVTAPDYVEIAACELFCLAKADCSITLERIQQVFQSRVESYFDTPFGALGTIVDLFSYFVGNPVDGTIIADAMNLVLLAGGVLTNQFLGDVGTKTLQALLVLAVNDASSDWITLCPDCPNEFEVPATVDPWVTNGVDSDYDVIEATDYVIIASGLWNGGAGGDVTADGTGTPNAGAIAPTASLYSLLYRIGTTGDWLFCGEDNVITAGATGRLYFCFNDIETGYADNSGAVTVIVSLAP